MSNNPQQWNLNPSFMVHQGGEPGQTQSNGSYSPHSSTSDISSSSQGSYYWAPGAVIFGNSPVTAWTGPLDNSTTIGLPNSSTVQHHAHHGQQSPAHHAGCHPMGTICQYCMILYQFRDSHWRRMHEMEPRDQNTGRSVLMELLEEFSNDKGRIYGCRICEEQFTRPDRAVTHLRHKHLDHRPFACQGQCGLSTCEQRFHSQENLSPHINPKTVDCPYCDHKCLRQNIKRHVQRYHAET